uniref:PE-PGRS family protein n=1 Tax=Parastrongyloides trichosuri TaxID=131310 RepID=A0A0N4ZGF1_PARTI
MKWGGKARCWECLAKRLHPSAKPGHAAREGDGDGARRDRDGPEDRRPGRGGAAARGAEPGGSEPGRAVRAEAGDGGGTGPDPGEGADGADRRGLTDDRFSHRRPFRRAGSPAAGAGLLRGHRLHRAGLSRQLCAVFRAGAVGLSAGGGGGPCRTAGAGRAAGLCRVGPGDQIPEAGADRRRPGGEHADRPHRPRAGLGHRPREPEDRERSGRAVGGRHRLALHRPVRHGLGHHERVRPHRCGGQHQSDDGGPGHRRGPVRHGHRPGGGHPGLYRLQRLLGVGGQVHRPSGSLRRRSAVGHRPRRAGGAAQDRGQRGRDKRQADHGFDRQGRRHLHRRGRTQAAGELGAGVDRLGHRDRRRAGGQSSAGALAGGRGDRAGRDPARAGSAGAEADPAAAQADAARAQAGSDASGPAAYADAHAASHAAQADAADPRAASDPDAAASDAARASSPDAARTGSRQACAGSRPGRPGWTAAPDAEPGPSGDGSAGL